VCKEDVTEVLHPAHSLGTGCLFLYSLWVVAGEGECHSWLGITGCSRERTELQIVMRWNLAMCGAGGKGCSAVGYVSNQFLTRIWNRSCIGFKVTIRPRA